MKFIFLLLSLMFTQLNASECTSIDLRSEKLGDARNQGEISWCYAFASADFLNFYNPGESPSPAAVALLYNTHSIPSTMHDMYTIFYLLTKNPRAYMPFQTGFSQIALKLNLETGLCNEKDFPSEKWTKIDYKTKIKSEVLLDEAILEIYKMKQMIKKGLSHESIGYSYQFPNINSTDFYELVKQYSIKDLFNQIRISSCSFRPLTPMKTKMSLKNKKIMDEIDYKLDQNEPILVDYDSRILINSKPSSGMPSLHTSLIVGRRFNSTKNRCEYLIKNSYGKDCNVYDSDYSCEEGFVWLPTSNLYKSMTSIVYKK